MTTNNINPDDNHDRIEIDPLRPDRLRCACGATADYGGRCRKCRARAAWACRTAGRRPYDDRLPRLRSGRSRLARTTANPIVGRCNRTPRRDEGIEL
jgi:hypothetical protein